MCSLSSLSCISPISLCFLHKFLSSADLAEVIISSSFIPHCSLNVISRVVSFFMLLSSIVFLSMQSFPSIHEVLKGFRDFFPLSISSLILVMLRLLSHLMLIVFPLIVLTYTVM